MQVIAVIAQKGGVGKSMLARSLAVQGLIDGRKTAILDADPQGTVVSWGRRRSMAAPTVIELGSGTLPREIEALRELGAELVVIDTPPHAQPIISVAASSADALLLITGPYPEDLEQVGVAAGITQALRKPAGIILNKTPAKAHAIILARTALTAFQMPVCPTALTNLVSHPYASAEGLTAQEREPRGRAAAEVREVWSWVRQNILAN